VGRFESTLSYTDKYGRRGGIAYEYQQKLSAYTGWSYEYVEDSWANLFEMLANGEIDLLSDISYTEERSKKILYPRSPMGAESYYIYIDADDKEINPVKLETLEKSAWASIRTAIRSSC
jgi:ABC-type amino acid transport substrate-binding protein